MPLILYRRVYCWFDGHNTIIWKQQYYKQIRLNNLLHYFCLQWKIGLTKTELGKLSVYFAQKIYTYFYSRTMLFTRRRKKLRTIWNIMNRICSHFYRKQWHLTVIIIKSILAVNYMYWFKMSCCLYLKFHGIFIGQSK